MAWNRTTPMDDASYINKIVRHAEHAQQSTASHQVAVTEVREAAVEVFNRVLELVRPALPTVCNRIPTIKPPMAIADDCVPRDWPHVWDKPGLLIMDGFAAANSASADGSKLLFGRRLYLLETGELLELKIKSGWVLEAQSAWSAECHLVSAQDVFEWVRFRTCVQMLHAAFKAQDR